MRYLLGGLISVLVGCSSSEADPVGVTTTPPLDVKVWCPSGEPVSGADLGVVPVPKALYVAEAPVAVSSLGQVGADDVEAAEIARIAELRGLSETAKGGLSVVMHTDEEGQQLFERCGLSPAGGGAHVLRIDGAAMTANVIAPDAQGRFYALQTLQQLIVAAPEGARVRPVTVYDAPAVGRRGVLEGFYGTPWADADRVAFMEALGDLKFNYYAYAPKNDDSINRERFRDLEEQKPTSMILNLHRTTEDFAHTMVRWVDNIVLARRYIGPVKTWR